MKYTVTTQFKTERLYSRTDKIDADTPKAAKNTALNMLLREHPEATNVRQRAQKSHKA